MNDVLDSQKPIVKRLLFSAVIVAIAVYFNFFAPFWVFFIGFEIAAFFCLFEFFNMLDKKGFLVHKVLGIGFGLLIPLNCFFPAEPVTILFAILALFLVGFDRNSPTASRSITLTANTLFGLIYISWLASYFLKLRAIPETGMWWVFFVIFVVKMGDAAAYFIGKKWGRHKLIPHISPNKSVEGAVACIVTVVLLALSAKIYLPKVPMIHFFIMGLILSVLSQLGDLAESLIKRNLEAKDSGTIPGLGGMLDIVDSLLFSAPFVYCYITNISGIL